MLKAKNETYTVEWCLVNATRINVERGFETIEEARSAMEKIKCSYPVAFACIGKAKKA